MILLRNIRILDFIWDYVMITNHCVLPVILGTSNDLSDFTRTRSYNKCDWL